jgi:hypothetical protein
MASDRPTLQVLHKTANQRHALQLEMSLTVGFGRCRKLKNEEFINLYSSANVIRVIKLGEMRGAERVSRMEEMRNTYNILVGNPQGKRSLARPRRTWLDNIKMVTK